MERGKLHLEETRMPNGKQMLNDLELEQRIASFSPAEQFLAREIYDMKKACAQCGRPSKQQQAYNYTGLTGMIVAIGAAIKAWFYSP